MQMLSVELKSPQTLSDEERAAWRGMLTSNPFLVSPYLTLGYVDAVSHARPDIKVAVIRRGDRIAGFFAFQKGPMGHARAPGGVVNDCHAVICAPGEDIALSHVLIQAGVEVFDFKDCLAAQAPFRRHAEFVEGGWIIDISDGFDAYVAQRKKPGGNTFRSAIGAPKKLAKEGELTFRFDDRRPETLEALYAWKSAQYRESGFPDLFALKWVRDLIEQLWRQDRAEGAGLMSTLELDGRLAAVHFGLIGPTVLHSWFPAYDPEFAHLTPGNALLIEMLQAGAEAGVREVHMGPGDQRQKQAMGSFQEGLATGCITRPGLVGWARQAAGYIEKTAEPLPLGPLARAPGKAFRKIDRIAALYGV
jgi:CelD/BcsL family acetyltransferase involved in cellulose biosynthesis